MSKHVDDIKLKKTVETSVSLSQAPKKRINLWHNLVVIFCVIWAQLFVVSGIGRSAERIDPTLKYHKVQWDKMDITDFCKYGLSDYETLKPSIEKMFLSEPNISKAKSIIETIKNKKNVKEYELPKIKNRRVVSENGKLVFSGEKLILWTVPCNKKFKNKDIWYFIFHVGLGGEIKNFDFTVHIEDENFAKRDVPLKPNYLYGRKDLSKAIVGLVGEKNLSIDSLVGMLKSNGFLVERRDQKTGGDIEYLITGKNIRHWRSVLPVPGGNGGVFKTLIFADSQGQMYQLDKFGRNKVWLK